MFLWSIILIGALLSERPPYFEREVNIALFHLIQGYILDIFAYAFLHFYSLNTLL
jgi:hypothetical protein